MRTTKILALALLIAVRSYAGDLLDESILKPFSQEISGELAKRNLEFITRQHRMRGSRGFQASAEFIAGELRKYGITDVHLEQFPADGKIFYGTQRSRRPWDADFAELWEMKDGQPQIRLASWDAMPLSLAQDSENADVTALLVDVGSGTAESDFANKDVRGKLVLVSEQVESVVPLAIDKFGAAGIISYAQNQKTAWWGEDENLVRWGHVGSFNKKLSFAFMISLKQARSFQKRLQAGEAISLHAKVIAGQHDGFYQVLTATIPGADPVLAKEEIVFSCHLDHPRPGANDNASGCAAILEVARSFSKLISEKKISRPARTLRFIWPPEVEGTLTFLSARPEIASRIKTAIHMDMVGGGPITKSVFHITRGPASNPSFVYDVVDKVGDFVNLETAKFADTGNATYPMIAAEGGKEALRAEFAPFSMGSDHEIYTESSFGIPAIYFNDWPDRYIHTNFDTAGNIDPTKLKRAAFIGAVTAIYLANFRQSDAEKLQGLLKQAELHRKANALKRAEAMTQQDAPSVEKFREWYEEQTTTSANDFLTKKQTPEIGKSGVYVRNPGVKGPMGTFGYNYLEDHYGREKAKALRLRSIANEEIYEYEVLNFVDGKRTNQEIRDLLTGAYGPVSLDVVEEYLKALEAIGVIRKSK
jgi:aminopeptidase YwaD